MGAAVIISVFGRLSAAIEINNGQIFRQRLSDDFIVDLIDFAQRDSINFLTISYNFFLTLVLFICLSVLVWLAVIHKKTLLYPAAVLLHALSFVPAILLRADVIESVWNAESMLMGCVVIVIGLTRYVYSKLQKKGDMNENEHA
jgi:uncharacterized membrane protein YhfC